MVLIKFVNDALFKGGPGNSETRVGVNSVILLLISTLVMLACLVDFSCGRYLATKTQVDSALRIEQVAKITLISVSIFTSLNTILGAIFIGIS